MAAITAARRGHRAILVEELGQLGGMLRVGALPPHKEEVGRLVRWLEDEARRAGVELHLGRTADWDLIRSFDPEAVIVATGARPASPDLAPGAAEILFAEDVLRGIKKPGDAVAVIGGGTVGCETAEFLAVRGHRVVLIEQEADVALTVHPRPRRMLVDRLVALGIDIRTQTRATRWADGHLILERGEVEGALPAPDTVIVAEGSVPRDDLVRSAPADRTFRLNVVGDARRPRTAAEALREGFDIAYAL
jgi:NADPH-dependent 2,4-dienoyl-CoA reductase/sulfur reductase-like enzyme